jgi:hypothetical protein
MIIEKLKKQVPEYFESEFGQELDCQNIYLVMGHFAQYLLSEIKSDTNINNTARRCISCVNEISDIKDSSISNIMIVGFGEVLTDDPECVDRIKNLLNHNATSYLHEAVNFWKGTPKLKGQ